MTYIGECAALATALCWTMSTLAFEAAARRVGSMAVNLIRLVMAWVLLAIYGWVFRGMPVPMDAPGRTWLWMLLSGLAGFFLCDMCLFRAWVLMGPRMTLLIFSLAPPLTALLAWAALGETLTWLNWLGMAVTLTGVTWVVAERKIEAAVVTWHVSARGVTLAAAAATAQALAVVLVKKGLLDDYDILAGLQIRATAGIAGFALLFAAVKWYPQVFGALRHGRAMALTAFGATVGTVTGVSLLMLSLRHLPGGVTQTIVATLPVMILPFTILLHRERVSLRAAAGACVAVAGVALLFLKGP